MREVYKEYVAEHPEELVGISTLKRHSRTVEKCREGRKKEELRKLRKWKEVLNGDYNR